MAKAYIIVDKGKGEYFKPDIEDVKYILEYYPWDDYGYHSSYVLYKVAFRKLSPNLKLGLVRFVGGDNPATFILSNKTAKNICNNCGIAEREFLVEALSVQFDGYGFDNDETFRKSVLRNFQGNIRLFNKEQKRICDILFPDGYDEPDKECFVAEQVNDCSNKFDNDSFVREANREFEGMMNEMDAWGNVD